jgi:hypothetical protein
MTMAQPMAIPGDVFLDVIARLKVARNRIVPESGSFIGWKKGRAPDGNCVLIRLEVPAEARRGSYNRECFAEAVRVLEIVGADSATSLWPGGGDPITYRVGEVARCHLWDEDGHQGGLHFYLSRVEAQIPYGRGGFVADPPEPTNA